MVKTRLVMSQARGAGDENLEEDEENLKKEGAEDPWHVEKLPLQAEKADLTAQKTNLS